LVVTIDRLIDSQMNNLILDLQKLIRQPSISAKNHGLLECAHLVSTIMQKAGIKTEVLYLKNSKHAPPIVYGEVISRSNPRSKTVLFYNHYDVQPVEPYELWKEDPFGGNIKDNKIFGRGSSDDKGELITRIKAIEYLLKESGDVPCNIKFVVEGEEEIGSIHLEKYLSQFAKKFSCDAIIWESGYVDAKDRPIIGLGTKGILYVELISRGPSIDVHSSLAVLIENPAWRIIKAINTLWDDSKAQILIKDWYKEVRGFSPEEISLISSEPLPFDEDGFKNKYGIKSFVADARGNKINLALMGMPTCNISGITSGYNGKGPKTVIPSMAKAKIDFRLVPNMSHEKQFERLRNHLYEKGFQDIKLVFIHGASSSRSPLNHPFVMQTQESAMNIFGATPVMHLSSSGAGPMHIFVRTFKIPCVSIGCTYIFSNIHSHNEYAGIDLLNKTTKWIANIIKRFANSIDKSKFEPSVSSNLISDELGIWKNF
jgi:acetylornithine deacetylase/succinyl-diaminopimelate desuccinylase-like protein